MHQSHKLQSATLSKCLFYRLHVYWKVLFQSWNYYRVNAWQLSFDFLSFAQHLVEFCFFAALTSPFLGNTMYYFFFINEPSVFVCSQSCLLSLKPIYLPQPAYVCTCSTFVLPFSCIHSCYSVTPPAQHVTTRLKTPPSK